MKGEIVGQGAVVVLVVAIVAAIVGGAIGYLLAPAEEVPPDIAELQAQISELEGTVADLETTIVDLQGQIPTPLDTVKVAFVGHGTAEDPCWIAYQNGAETLAESIRNVEVVFRYSKEDIALQVDMVREEIARGVDAIIVSIAHETALDAPVQEARDAGIVVIAFDTDDPEGAAGNARQAFVTSTITGKGICYDTSYMRGELVIDYFDGFPKGGHIFFPNEGPGATWSDQSRQGLVEYFEEQGYIEGEDWFLDEIDATYDVATAEERITAYILAHPEIDVIVSCGGCTSIASVLAQEALEMEPGELPIFSWPHGPVDARGIESGLVIAGVTDSHSNSGVLPLVQAVMAVRYGLEPVDMYMPLVVVDQSNIEDWASGWEKIFY